MYFIVDEPIKWSLRGAIATWQPLMMKMSPKDDKNKLFTDTCHGHGHAILRCLRTRMMASGSGSAPEGLLPRRESLMARRDTDTLF